MNCTNRNHHIENGEPCTTHHDGGSCSCNHHHNNNPHDQHYHINKNNIKALLLNIAYFTSHAVTIYLLLSK
jgi:hypothetical protein